MKQIFLFTIISCICTTTNAQTIIKKNPVIEEMVMAVNADSLKSYITSLVAFGTRNTLSNQSSKTRGIGAARTYVYNKFTSYARTSKSLMEVYIDTTTLVADGRRINRPIVLGNVIAKLHGTDKADKRIFIVTGHLDGMRTNVMDSTADAPGANDDGSGTAAVIELARIMSKKSFPATIIFVAVSGEEQGLLGAKYMADKAKTENWPIEAVLNNDIMGSNHSNQTNIINNTQVRIFSEGLPAFETEKKASYIRQMGLENDGESRQLARYVKELGERYVANLEVVMIYRNDRFLRGGDHTAYVNNGLPAVRITEMNENYTHQHQNVRVEDGIQYGDLPEFMDFEYLRKNTAVNLVSLAALASAPPKPVEVKIEVKQLTNYSTITWQPPATGAVEGYYVLVRTTTSAVWEKKIFTKDQKIQLPYSKDNYFFAVQSVDAAGNESLPVVPLVGR